MSTTINILFVYGNEKYYRDLLLIGIIDEERNLTSFGLKVISEEEKESIEHLKLKVVDLPKMAHLRNILKDKPKIKAKDLVSQEADNFFGGNKESSKLNYARAALTWIR